MLGRSVFFVQKRVGKDGRLFDCHKFITMKYRLEEEKTVEYLAKKQKGGDTQGLSDCSGV